MFDWREYAWRLAFRPLDRVAKRVGFYTSTPTGGREYVGTVSETERQVERRLRDLGVGRSLLSSVHIRESSYGDQAEDAAFVWRPWLFSRFQLHILLFANYDGTTSIYAHFERNPWRTPLEHYAGDDIDVNRGRVLAKSFLGERLDFVDEGYGATDGDA